MERCVIFSADGASHFKWMHALFITTLCIGNFRKKTLALAHSSSTLLELYVCAPLLL